MQLFPVFPKPVFVQWTRRETYGFETEAIFLVTHTGTHLDAPCHFYSKGKKVNEIPASKLVGAALVLDFTDKKAKSLIYEREVRRAESTAGEEIRSDDILLVRTGWDRFLGDEKYTSSYPGLSKDAVKEMILTKSHRELEMNKSTLWYQRKRLRETGSVRLYDKTRQYYTGGARFHAH
jgi:kynurenine formamidase